MHESYKKWLDDGKPEVFCTCSCGREIVVTRRHKYGGIPKYIVGHQIRVDNPSKYLEVRDKISKTLMGKYCGEKNPFYGKHHSQKTKDEWSKKRKGRKASEETKNKMRRSAANNPNFGRRGKKATEETKKKLSESHKYLCGELASNWQGGISFEPYCPKFNKHKREEIREKYNRKCYFCGKDEKDNKYGNGKQVKLSVHHLDRDKEQGCNGKSWELVPLCCNCHSKLHKKRKDELQK